MIVIDVLTGTMAGSENDDLVAKAWVAGVQELIRELDCAVLAITHTGWSDQGRARGHTHTWGSFDTRLKAEGDKETMTTTLTVNRHKDADTTGPFGFRMKGVQISLTSSTLVPLLDETVMPKKAANQNRRLGKNQKTALDALYIAIDRDGVSSPGFSGMPSGHVRVTAMDVWKEQVLEELKGERKHNRADEAIQGLLDNGTVLCHEAGPVTYVWPVYDRKR